jgi:hypothetical protein
MLPRPIFGCIDIECQQRIVSHPSVDPCTANNWASQDVGFCGRQRVKAEGCPDKPGRHGGVVIVSGKSVSSQPILVVQNHSAILSCKVRAACKAEEPNREEVVLISCPVIGIGQPECRPEFAVSKEFIKFFNKLLLTSK